MVILVILAFENLLYFHHIPMTLSFHLLTDTFRNLLSVSYMLLVVVLVF